MNKLFTQLLEKRHLSEDFLHPKYEDLADPFSLPDMKKAVARIKKALKNQEKILIYGDYDVDGITASAVMESALKLAGARPENLDIMLPDRFVDGYGMSPRLVERAKGTGVKLVVTVDCGSKNDEIVKQLKAVKIDSIITDHHEFGTEKDLPKAVAVVNPKRLTKEADPNHLRNLAGVGVAFKVAAALVQEKLIPAGQEKWLLDLVAIGTNCDRMDLTGENRILCFYGAKVLEKTRLKGLAELMRLSKVSKITSDAIGFQIGPRLNAAGRLETATIALELLRTSSPARAAALAAELNSLNLKRRTAQNSALNSIVKKGVDKDDAVIIESGPWHEGIIGIVAGRLVEAYHRPAFVFTRVEDGTFKGSGRSFGDFNLAEALTATKDLILSGGGHAGAAGVRIAPENLKPFHTAMNDYYKNLHLKDQEKYLIPRADLSVSSLEHLGQDLVDDLRTLEPFGPGNPEPLLCTKDLTILNTRRMGADGQHLRLDVKDAAGRIMKLVSFNAPEAWFTLDDSARHDFTIQLVENEFNGLTSVEGRLVAVDQA